MNWHHPYSLKFNCRYDIKINDHQFPTARTIIGSKGANMKSIIDKCCYKTVGNPHDIIKIRVRGNGSGYREGPLKQESSDPLHICVSSKFEDKYKTACGMVEKLLGKVYNEYYAFCRARRKPVPSYAISKREIKTGKDVVKLLRSLEGEINEDLVRDLIDIRNEARKHSNFAQADLIRDHLRQKGITLIDGKGARGNSSEVTTWKYTKI